MEAVPTWARVLGVLVAVVTVPTLVGLVVGGVLTIASTEARLHRTTTYAVGAAPALQLDAQFTNVVVEAGAPGRIVVDEDNTASTVTRAAAGSAVASLGATTSLRGDVVSVRQRSVILHTWSSSIKVHVPPRTDLDLRCVCQLDVDGVDGTMSIGGTGAPGSVDLRDVTLRGDSSIATGLGNVDLENATVVGTTTVTAGLGKASFDGRLAPGGAVLDVTTSSSNVAIRLPYPTDARATVAVQHGNLNASPVWNFAGVPGTAARRWAANLSATPNPSGLVNVTTGTGNVTFAVR